MSEDRLTRTVMRRDALTADEAISKYKQASIRRQFPAQFIRSTLEEIEDAARVGQKPARAALKLLFSRRFDKE